MLKELFEGHFYGTFPKVPGKTLSLNEVTKEGDFVLLDVDACRDCLYVCTDEVASREQLKVHATQPVGIISIGEVFNFVQEDVGEICDYMMEDGQTSVLIEMTCSTSGYVKDKRQKAKRQLFNTLCLLFANPIVREHLEQHEFRYVLFSWKETFDPILEKDPIESSMTDMTIMADSVYSPNNELKFDFDFKLREVRYPDVFMM